MLLAVNVFVMFSRVLLQGQPSTVIMIVQFAVMGSAFGVLFLRNQLLTVEASKYDIYRVHLSPPGKSLDLAVTKSGLRPTEPNPRFPQINNTTLELADEMKIEPYGNGEKIKRFHINHTGKLKERLDSVADYAEFKGEKVWHNNIYLMTLWQNDLFPVGQEESRPEPNFVLITSSEADRSDRQVKTKVLSMALGFDNPQPNILAGQKPKVRTYIKRLESENQRLRNEVVEERNYVTSLVSTVKHWRINAIKAGQKLGISNQEITGLLDTPTDVKKAAIRRNQADISNIQDVFDIGKRDNWWNKIDWKWIIIGVVFMAVLVYFGLNTKAQDAVGKFMNNPFNWLLAILLFGVIGAVIYYGSKAIKERD